LDSGYAGRGIADSNNQLAHAAEGAGQNRLLAQISERSTRIIQDEPVGVKRSSKRKWPTLDSFGPAVAGRVLAG
jgi:hypothetical protein